MTPTPGPTLASTRACGGHSLGLPVTTQYGAHTSPGDTQAGVGARLRVAMTRRRDYSLRVN